MPLNNHPSAKPTYDFYDTVNKGRPAIANGRLLRRASQPAGQQVPGRLDHLPLALGRAGRQLPRREQRRRATTSPPDVGSDGIRYYEAQASVAQRGRRSRPTGR